MDANNTAIMQLITPRPGGTDHIDSNQVWCMQVWMLMHPHKKWLKARNSTHTAAKHSQGQYRKRQANEAQRLREELKTPTRSEPERQRPTMANSHPSCSPPQYRSNSRSPDRQAAHCVAAQQTDITSSHNTPHNTAVPSSRQSRRTTYISRLRRRRHECVQKKQQKHPSSTAAPWYLQLKVMLTFITIHMLAAIGAVHQVLISTLQVSYGN